MARILVIDDDPLVRTTLRKVLERAGHQVAEAADGAKGLDQYRAQRADVVVTDIIMPDKEGIATIMDLRRFDPAVKIIAMSGGGRTATFDFLRIAKEFGAAKTLQKPFANEALLAAIQECIA